MTRGSIVSLKCGGVVLMVSLSIEAIAILCYTAVALFLSLYFVPFKIVPRAWAKAVQTKGHPAQVALDAVLEGAAPKVAAAVALPDTKALQERIDKLVEGFNQIVPLVNNLAGDNLVTAIKTAYRDVRQGEILRGDLPAGDLTVAQQKELDDLVRDPDGKAALVAAENAIDAAVAGKWMKPGTGKAVKKQLNAAFSAGQPIESILAPYEALLARIMGAPSVNIVGGGGHSSASKGPRPI